MKQNKPIEVKTVFTVSIITALALLVLAVIIVANN